MQLKKTQRTEFQWWDDDDDIINDTNNTKIYNAHIVKH